jgi:hypothetical protein
VNSLRADRSGEREWYQEPAWISLFATMLLHICLGAYLYGAMVSKVDALDRQNQIILQYMLQHVNEGAVR